MLAILADRDISEEDIFFVTCYIHITFYTICTNLYLYEPKHSYCYSFSDMPKSETPSL